MRGLAFVDEYVKIICFITLNLLIFMEFPVNEVEPRFPWFLKLLDWVFFFLLLPIAVKILVYLALLQILLLDP